MNIDEVKKFIEDFCQAEAKASTARRKPDLEAYRNAFEEMHQFVNRGINLGHGSKAEKESPQYYEEYKDFPDSYPRELFKISAYQHSQYGDVWVAYLSGENPDPVLFGLNLSHAFFIILENGKPVISKIFIYSDYDDRIYSWKDQGGLSGLTFESLEGPHDIWRYKEPDDAFDGLKLYHDNI